MAAQRTARKQSRPNRDDPKDEATQYEQELASYLQERIKPGLNKGAIPLLARSIAKELAQRGRPDDAASDSEKQDDSGAEAELEPTDEVEDEPSEEADDEPSEEAEDEGDLDDEPRDEAEDEEDLDEPRDEAEDEEDLDEPRDEAEADQDLDDEPDDDAEDEEDDVSEESEEQPDFEADMRELQAELGDEWVLAFSVKGDEAWLTAEKEDGSQHVEAQTADLLLEAVELLEEGGGRSG